MLRGAKTVDWWRQAPPAEPDALGVVLPKSLDLLTPHATELDVPKHLPGALRGAVPRAQQYVELVTD